MKLPVSSSRFTHNIHFLLVLALTVASAHAQLQWSSYDKNGNLVTANVASGGDSTYGGSVTFTIPASGQLELVTKSFVPFSTSTAGSSGKVTFNISASGGMTSRCFGYGLFNDPGTLIQAMGYWGDFNIGGPYFECFQRSWTNATYMVYDSGNAMNSGKSNSGTPVAGTTYAGQIQVNNKSGAMQIGTGSGSVAAAGLVCNGSGVTQQSYGTTVKNGTNVNVTTFNEFAVMFANGSASPVTLTLSAVSLVPPNPALSTAPQNYSGSAGSTATFTAIVNTNALAPMGYQWYETNASGTVVALTDGTTASGAVVSGSSTLNSTLYTNVLTISNAQSGDNNGNIFVVITNAYGATTSAPVSLAILPPTPPGNLVVAPSVVTVISGQSTNFSATCLASPTPAYYWFDNNSSLIQSGGSATLILTNVMLAKAGTYSVIASNYLGTATNYFTVNVIVPPCISQQPANVLVNLGDPVNLYVVEGGCALPAPGYQWLKNGAVIPGANAANFPVASVAWTDIGKYSVIISNTAGSVTSSNAVLSIYSTNLVGAPVAPANGATGVCYDTPLYLCFNAPISIANAGKIRIYNAANPATPVDVIDVGANNVIVSTLAAGVYVTNNIQAHGLFSGDSQAINYMPVIISGTNVVIYPHTGVMTSNQTYYVTMDSGIVADNLGGYFAGISATNVWQFTTKAGGPANPNSLVVAADGSGDFATVQGAVDSIPSGNTTYTVVNIRNGVYTEIVDISGKNNITFRGQSRAGTVVGYPNNNNFTATTAGRMAFKVNGSDIKLENLTVTNGTPQGGSQAEALLIYNNGLRCVVNNCDIVSRQDTILINASTSEGYFLNCRIVGNFDYVWGVGIGYFDTCVFHTITNIYSGSYNLTAARTLTAGSASTNTPWVNPNGTTYSANGFSFVNCKLEADTGVSKITLADSNGTAGGLDSWANCLIDTNAYISPQGSMSNSYVFWQNNNLDISGTYPISFTNVQTTGVTNNDPRLLAATNIVTWFYGWTPQMAPNITSQPAGQTVTAGQSASFSVGATGLPTPAYQWQHAGTNVTLPSATSATLTIASAQRSDGGNYAVIVSNGSGIVTSSVVTLTYNNTAPVAQAFTMGAVVGVPVTVQLIGGKFAPTDADNDTLTVTGVAGAANGVASTDGTTITYTATSGPGDSFTYTVSDGFGGTATATITVVTSENSQGYNQLSVANFGNGTNVLSFSGIPTDNYALDMATNLLPPIVWMPQTTNPAASDGSLNFTNVSPEPQSFYRTRYVP